MQASRRATFSPARPLPTKAISSSFAEPFIAVDAYPSGPQAGDAVLLDGPLPREELLNRQAVAQARLLDADHADAHGLKDGGLAPRRPTLCVGWRKFDCHRREIA